MNAPDNELGEPDNLLVQVDNQMGEPDALLVQADNELSEPDNELVRPDSDFNQPDELESVTPKSARYPKLGLGLASR